MSPTKAFCEEKAEALAAAEIVANSLGMANAASQTAQDAVKAQATLRMARDRADALRVEYNRAFDQWRLAGFPD